MRLGIEPRTAQQQAQHIHHTGLTPESLPDPTGKAPYRITSEDLQIPPTASSRTFHVIGDSGGIMDPNPQQHVANAMVADLQEHPEVAFAYHVGDVVYFNGRGEDYGPQFYEPYASYLRHVVAIPGNHDGWALPGETSLDGFVRHFCDAKGPRLLPEVEEYHTDTLPLPNVYWTLLDDELTIVGCYTNVPSGGFIDSQQGSWLEGELADAPTDKPLLVAMHHPPYSGDGHHGGSKVMGEVLDRAAGAAGRFPDMVLTGHVHNYQRWTRVQNGASCTYIVCGGSGYHNLHRMAKGAQAGLEAAPGVTLDAFEDDAHGFLRLSVGEGQLKGVYTAVDKEGGVSTADSFGWALR